MTVANTTFENLHEYLGEMLGEPYGTYNRWTLDVRNLFLNKGIQKVAEMLRCCTATETVDSASGVASYDLTVSGTLTHEIFDIDEKKGILYDGKRLNRYDDDELDIYDPDRADAETGTPDKYVFDFDTKTLELHAPPTSGVADIITVNYVYLPDPITDVSESPDIPESKRYAASVWAAWKLYQGRRKYNQAKEYKAEFYEEMKVHFANREAKPDALRAMTSYVNGFTKPQDRF